MLAEWIGAPDDEITYVCAGINHQAWYTRSTSGTARTPIPSSARPCKRPEIYNEEIVRNEMFMHLGYYVTESSGHNSEYNWWFRKRPDLIEKYCTHGTGWNPGVYAYILDEYLQARRRLAGAHPGSGWTTPTPLNLARGHEYAAYYHQRLQGRRAIQVQRQRPQYQADHQPAR